MVARRGRRPPALARPQALVLRFVGQHLYDPVRRAENPSHGMPDAVEAALRRGGRLRVGGPHAPSTVRRRLALCATFHRWFGLEGPFSSPNLRGALRLAVRAARRLSERKSAKPLTREVLERLIAVCDGAGLADRRDAASCSSPSPRAVAAAPRSPA